MYFYLDFDFLYSKKISKRLVFRKAQVFHMTNSIQYFFCCAGFESASTYHETDTYHLGMIRTNGIQL